MPDPEKKWQIKMIKADGEEGDGLPAFTDGKPVYISPEGKEVPLDPPAMYTKIIDLGKESKGHREAADALKATLKLFDGIEADALPEWKKKADDALKQIENLNDGDWLKAEKVEKLKAEMTAAYDGKVEQLKTSYQTKEAEFQTVVGVKDAQIRSLMVSNKFATHSLFSGPKPKSLLLPDIAESYFGKHFKVEENEKTKELTLVATHSNGDMVISHQNPGEPAEFTEAMEIIFEAFPDKDRLLRATDGGSDAGGGGGADEGETGDVAKLEKEYAEAQKAGDGKKMIAIKNQLFQARQAAKAA